jgi:hypothetical protein
VSACSKHLLKGALNFALSFLRTVTLGGKLLKNFMSAQNVHFLNKKKKKQDGWHLICEDDTPCINIAYR